MIQGEIEYTERIAAWGGFSEVRKGTYGGKEVAVKCIKFTQHATSEKIMRVSGAYCGVQVVDSQLQVLCKEVIIWATLNHPNVVPFIGVTATPRFPSLITQWMAFGNIRSFSMKRPDLCTNLVRTRP